MALNKTHSVMFRRNAFCEIIHFTVCPNGELRGVRINMGSAISGCLSLTDAKGIGSCIGRSLVATKSARADTKLSDMHRAQTASSALCGAPHKARAGAADEPAERLVDSGTRP